MPLVDDCIFFVLLHHFVLVSSRCLRLGRVDGAGIVMIISRCRCRISPRSFSAFVVLVSSTHRVRCLGNCSICLLRFTLALRRLSIFIAVQILLFCYFRLLFFGWIASFKFRFLFGDDPFCLLDLILNNIFFLGSQQPRFIVL